MFRRSLASLFRISTAAAASATSRRTPTQRTQPISPFRKYFRLGVSLLVLGGGGIYVYPKIREYLDDSKPQPQSQLPPPPQPHVTMEVKNCLKMIDDPEDIGEKKRGIYRLLLRIDPDRASDDSVGAPREFRIDAFNHGGNILMNALNHPDPVLNQLAAEAWFYISQEESLRDKIGFYSLRNFVELIQRYRQSDIYVLCRLCDSISFLITDHPKNLEKVVSLGLLPDICNLAWISYSKSVDPDYKRIAGSAFGTIERIVSSYPIDSLDSLNLSPSEVKSVVKAFELIGLSHCDSKELFASRKKESPGADKEIAELAVRNMNYCLAFSPNNFGIPYRIGARLLENGFEDEAAQCLRVALANQPKNIQCMWLLSQILMKGDQDSKQEASGFLGDILDTMEKDKISSFELQIEEKIEDEEDEDEGEEEGSGVEQVEELELELEQTEEDETKRQAVTTVEVLRKCWLLQFEEKNFQEAARTASKAIVLQPSDPRLHYSLGRSLRAMNKTTTSNLNKEALSSFQTAIELGSDSEALSASIYYSMGLCHHQEGNLQESERCFREAAATAPTNLDYSMSLVRVLTQLKKFDESLSVLQKVRTSITDTGKVHLAIIQTNKLKNDPLGEARAWEQFLKLWSEEGKNPLFMSDEERLKVLSTLLEDVELVVQKTNGFDFLLDKAREVADL